MQIKWAENAREKQKSQGLFRMVRSKPLVGYRTSLSDRLAGSEGQRTMDNGQ